LIELATGGLAMLPGSVGLTHLRVYDTESPDGLRGGSPHLHFACTECYYVEKGRGLVQTLCAAGYREFSLEPGEVVWFSPGVIHRLVNIDALEIFVVMQNSGLPEAGDFVLTMPEDVMADPDKYFAAASLAAGGEVYANGIEAAHRRRDMAVLGFAELRRQIGERGLQALEAFYQAALPLVRPKIDAWENIRQTGPLAAAVATGQQLAALQSGDISHLLNGSVHSMPPPEDRRLGMCGTLGTYLPEGVTTPSNPS